MIEKTQRSTNIAKTLEYLEKGNGKADDMQIRHLYNAEGKKIDNKTAYKMTKMFEANDVRIYNPQTDNLTEEEMHKMAQDIVDARSKQAGEKTRLFSCNPSKRRWNKQTYTHSLYGFKKSNSKRCKR
ncbi:hypothetical protein FJR45_06700 [Sulfurimonas sediminis]|uniref:Uncharacterized protein n=1 Tax=Sulfurimonas sediminis TaxID=2590020 RepID=A0A7M1B203_9BACT|nr:hypothetical protein [Sulfurimonas sediminis]QOP43655.1 hypothetical protein FJR45_06700 [Sulfurimonas sediminis]